MDKNDEAKRHRVNARKHLTSAINHLHLAIQEANSQSVYCYQGALKRILKHIVKIRQDVKSKEIDFRLDP